MSDDIHGSDALSPEEREGYARLPREKQPGTLLEERVVRALQDEGLLSSERQGRAPVRPRYRRPAWIAGGAAAALALFLSGLVVGQWLGARTASNAFLAVRDQDAARAADHVQATGSAYVRALTHLAELSREEEGSSRDVTQGREAALGALLAATEILAHLSADDPAARDLLRALRTDGGTEARDTTETQQFYWF